MGGFLDTLNRRPVPIVPKLVSSPPPLCVGPICTPGLFGSDDFRPNAVTRYRALAPRGDMDDRIVGIIRGALLKRAILGNLNRA